MIDHHVIARTHVITRGRVKAPWPRSAGPVPWDSEPMRGDAKK